LLVTYGWCVLIPSEEGIEISNMDNVFLYADNDRVTDIFTNSDRMLTGSMLLKYVMHS
jgi:hypothetical protein